MRHFSRKLMALTNLTSVAWPPPVTSEVPTSPDPGQWGSGTPPASARSCFWNVDISSRVPPCFYLASAPSPPTFGFLASLWLLWSKYFPLLPVPTRLSSYRFLLSQLLTRVVNLKPTKCYGYLGVLFSFFFMSNRSLNLNSTHTFFLMFYVMLLLMRGKS